MNQKLAQVALVVRDYDEAIRFYTDILKFELVEDTQLSPTKRWVIVQPTNSSGCRLLLAKAVGDEQASRIGNQTGGRVFLFIHTDNFQRDYEFLKKKGIKFVREPSRDLIDLIEPTQ
jgi:catechol 2,3-dioxygenase-like lactoylglutathione lyase family enzyme